MNLPAIPEEELVVLVDDENRMLGTCPKSSVHGPDTPLHRAFSVFLFNSQGRVLLQQRALSKLTWPGVWSGSCCGHPLPGERAEDAIRRRASRELGLPEIRDLTEMLPRFRYRCERDGVVENEICPVWVGIVDTEPVPASDEVEACRWEGWDSLVSETREHPGRYAQWCEWEVEALERLPEFAAYRSRIH